MPIPPAAIMFAMWITSMLISNVMRMLAADIEDEPEAAGILANAKRADWDIPLIYGKCRVGINIVYVGTTGATNDYLHYIGVLGEGPINGIAKDPIHTSIDGLYLDGELWNTNLSAADVHYEIFTGTSTQTVCSTLNSAIGTWTDPLHYTAYIYVRLKYDQDKFVKKPDITVLVEGLKVYDPVADTTAYSNNPVLAIHDLLTRTSKRGGMGIDSARFDTDSIEVSRDYCTAKGWTANMAINKNNAISDNVQLILNCFRGSIIYSENVFKIRFSDLNYESTSMTFGEDDILDSVALTVTPNANLFDRPNCVKAIFFNSAKNFIEDSFSFPDSTAIALDGDHREREIRLLGLSTLDKVQPMAYYYLERWRWGNIAEFGTVSKAMSIEPGDIIEIDHSLVGWDSQLLRVLAPSINSNAEVALSCIEEKDELYDDNYNPPPASEWHDTTLPNPLAPPPSPINISNYEEVYYYRGRSFTRWKIDFDSPLPGIYPFWDYAEIWIKIGSGTYTLGFDASSGTFIVSMVITGADSGAVGTIAGIIYTGATTGTLYLVDVVGAFEDDEIIYVVEYGSDLITNGDMELDSYWNAYGTSTEGQDLVTFHGGAASWKFTPDAINEGIVSGVFTTTTGSFYISSSWVYPDDGTIINVQVKDGAASAFHTKNAIGLTQDAWNNIIHIYLEDAGGAGAYVAFESAGQTSGDFYVDDVIHKPITTAALANGTLQTNEYRYMTKSTSDYVLDPVEESETYYVKLRSVSIYGVKENFDNAAVVSKTIIGKTTLPTDLTSMTAIANGDTVTVFADPVSDPDIVGYEVRLGDAWDGAIFISFNMNCSLRLVGVRPGTHTFWMSPVDNAGSYSDNPVYATVQVFTPPGFTELATYGTWAWDFTTGTLVNTEHTTQSSEDALMCSHTGSLTGTWESPSYDLGAADQKVRIWGDFRTEFVSTDTTWEGVAPVDVEETVDNDVAVDKGGGSVGIPITGHGYSAADVIGVNGTVNYDGGYTIVSETTDEIVITATYVAETFAGTETVKSGTLWSDLSADTLSWQDIFQPTAAGIVRAQLKYSGTDADWDTNPYFNYLEILSAEVETRYVRIKVTITDPTYDANLYLLELNMSAYTGPQ